jgi:drug/metabolite transporter (DMT)-like permease
MLGWVLLIALAGDAMVAAGDIFAKRWSLTGGLTWSLLGATLCYAGTTSLWMAMIRTVGGLAKASLFWVGTGTLVPVALAYFVFGEPIPWNMKLAVLLCTAGVTLAAIK